VLAENWSEKYARRMMYFYNNYFHLLLTRRLFIRSSALLLSSMYMMSVRYGSPIIFYTDCIKLGLILTTVVYDMSPSSIHLWFIVVSVILKKKTDVKQQHSSCFEKQGSAELTFKVWCSFESYRYGILKNYMRRFRIGSKSKFSSWQWFDLSQTMSISA